MPSPREQAERFNSSQWEGPMHYDAEAGAPSGVQPSGSPQDVSVNPVNPPAAAPPAKNLKG